MTGNARGKEGKGRRDERNGRREGEEGREERKGRREGEEGREERKGRREGEWEGEGRGREGGEERKGRREGEWEGEGKERERGGGEREWKGRGEERKGRTEEGRRKGRIVEGDSAGTHSNLGITHRTRHSYEGGCHGDILRKSQTQQLKLLGYHSRAYQIVGCVFCNCYRPVQEYTTDIEKHGLGA